MTDEEIKTSLMRQPPRFVVVVVPDTADPEQREFTTVTELLAYLRELDGTPTWVFPAFGVPIPILETAAGNCLSIPQCPPIMLRESVSPVRSTGGWLGEPVATGSEVSQLVEPAATEDVDVSVDTEMRV